MNTKNLGTRLKSLRKLSGMSRESISLNYNIPAASIKLWEKSDNITIANLLNYLKVFESKGIFISLDSLVKDSELLVTDYQNNSLSTGNGFLSSSLCQELLKNALNVVFYANLNSQIIYLNPVFQFLILNKFRQMRDKRRKRLKKKV